MKQIVKFEEKMVCARSVQHLVQQGALSEHIWNLCSIYQISISQHSRTTFKPNFTDIFLSVRAVSKNTVCIGWPCIWTILNMDLLLGTLVKMLKKVQKYAIFMKLYPMPKSTVIFWIFLPISPKNEKVRW